MKQQEIIKQMVKNVIKVNLVLGVFLVVGLFPQITLAQKERELSREQHKIVENSFRYSTEKSILIYHQTIGYESWMDLIWSVESRDEKGIGFCTFDDPELERAFDNLRELVKNLEVKSLVREKLEKRYKLTKNSRKDNILFLSEPMIIGNYSFLYRKLKSNTSLFVQKRDLEGDWDYECGVTIYGELH